jgi:chorismate mutase
MTEFPDPLRMLRSVYSHIEAANHEINLADDSKRRWIGFSCVGCNDEYITWQCPTEAFEGMQDHRYSMGDRLLIDLIRNQEGRISVRDAINRLVLVRTTAKKFSQIKSSNHTPLVSDPNSEVRMLESLFTDREAELTNSNDDTIITILRKSFRYNIPNRYNREPVI